MPVASLQARGHAISLASDQIAPQLHATAVAGSMLEQMAPQRAAYATPDQLALTGQVRNFGQEVVDQARDLRETITPERDVTLDDVWKLAQTAPPEVAAAQPPGTLLVDLVARTLESYGAQLFDTVLTNPDWRRWTRVATVVSSLATIAAGAATIASVLVAGPAAAGAAILVLSGAAVQVVTAIASLAQQSRG